MINQVQFAGYIRNKKSLFIQLQSAHRAHIRDAQLPILQH